MKILKDLIAAALLWADVSMMALAAGFSFITGLTCLSTWSTAQEFWTATAFPLDQWNVWPVVSEWVVTGVSNGALISVAWAWLYTCVAGFMGTVSVLSGHEAFCRLRVRLG